MEQLNEKYIQDSITNPTPSTKSLGVSKQLLVAGLKRLRALHPNGQWPANSDIEAWKEIGREWLKALGTMTDKQFQTAINYYTKSTQIKYVPSPAALWQVLNEVPKIQAEEREADRQVEFRNRSNQWKENFKESEKDRSSKERLAEMMAEIRSQSWYKRANAR